MVASRGKIQHAKRREFTKYRMRGCPIDGLGDARLARRAGADDRRRRRVPSFDELAGRQNSFDASPPRRLQPSSRGRRDAAAVGGVIGVYGSY